MPESSTTESAIARDEGSLFLGLLVAWLLNVVQLGIACLLFALGERTLPAVVVMVGGIGLLQISYVVPLWYVFRRRGRKRMAKGILMGAVFTLLLNAIFWAVIYLKG
ncbi:MAG TPA: hypothetical protein VI685_19035 [Candidatus Angelobacter sp.]